MSNSQKMDEIVEGFPNICGMEKEVAIRPKAKEMVYAPTSNIDIGNVQSSFGIVLHMHQPALPAGGSDLHSAELISNLQHMMNNQHIGDNHNAPVFFWCYTRMADFIPELVGQGRNPRVMLDYSGTLLWGLRQIDNGSALEKLKRVASDKNYYKNCEWLGTMWAHAVASSTPIPDLKLHMLAWRQHFASIFGMEALDRVKGFSPPEMHLPIHPDISYEYVKALKECGYEWIAVQEHTIQNLDGSGIKRPHFPHRLVAKNSLGKTEEITVLVKTQGSDTKLVAQMQPYYEARSRGREDYTGKNIPSFVLQVGDGENGGVMMNEFPPASKQAFQEIGMAGTVGMNGSEYIEFLRKSGLDEKKYMPVQPVSQHRIWEYLKDFHPGAADEAIRKVHEKDQGFNLDKGSWTSDKNWVKGYENVLDPINKLSVEFHKKVDHKKIDTSSFAYRKALLYLLVSQTSCYRYWGQGIWTEYAKEICRRGMEAVQAL